MESTCSSDRKTLLQQLHEFHLTVMAAISTALLCVCVCVGVCILYSSAVAFRILIRIRVCAAHSLHSCISSSHRICSAYRVA